MQLFRTALAKYNRIAIAGGCKTGKTTLSNQCTDRFVISTDNYIHLGWENMIPAIIQDCQDLDKFVLEGVQAVRCLRKGLIVDCIIFKESPLIKLTDKQTAMNNGINKMFAEYLNTSNNSPVVFRM